MPGATKLLIRGGAVYDHDGDVHHPRVADILIEGDRIAAVGTGLAADGEHEVIDASRHLVLPGLINAHYHSHDTLCRGLFEELPLEMWLLYTQPMGQNRSKEEVRARTLVGALESLRCGITTVRTCWGFRRSMTSTPRSCFPPTARQAFASCSRPWSRICPPSQWSVIRTACRPMSRTCSAARRCPCASRLTTSITNSSIGRPAAPCIGRLPPLPLSAARHPCWRLLRRLRRGTSMGGVQR